MKKRVYDYNDNECKELFDSLTLPQKRQILQIFDPTNENLFRDVIGIVAKYVSIQTWGRLKQCCKTFQSALILHPKASMVISVLQNPPNPAITIYDTAKILFYPYMRRLLLFLNDYDNRIHNYLQNLPHPSMDQTISLRIRIRFNLDSYFEKLQRFQENKWFHVLKFRVHFPYGFICPKESFNSIGNIYFDGFNNLFEYNKYYNIVSRHPRFSHWYEHCKLYMESINKGEII